MAQEPVRQAVRIDRDWLFAGSIVVQFEGRIVSTLESFHADHPLRDGMPREEIRSRCGDVREDLFAAILSRLEVGGVVVINQGVAALRGHSGQLDPQQADFVRRIEQIYREAGMTPGDAATVLNELGISSAKTGELLQRMVTQGTLVRVKDGLYFFGDAMRDAEQRLVAHFQQAKDIGVADFKELMGVTRKHAMPLLEYFDSRKVTIRVGDRRVLRRRTQQ